jgi:hypothetical protein
VGREPRRCPGSVSQSQVGVAVCKVPGAVGVGSAGGGAGDKRVLAGPL